MFKYAVFENFAANLYSIYSPEVFQIDANFGFSAALLVSFGISRYLHCLTCVLSERLNPNSGYTAD